MIKKILLCLLALLVLYLCFSGWRNSREMEQLTNDAIETLSESFTLQEKDPGEYRKISIYKVLPFHVKQYDVEGLGNLSVMTVNIGLMQMLTFVVTPLEKDVPLLSVDYIYMLMNRKAILEFYDLTEDKEAPAYQELLSALEKIQAE